jgi:hypothetical protein
MKARKFQNQIKELKIKLISATSRKLFSRFLFGSITEEFYGDKKSSYYQIRMKKLLGRILLLIKSI